MVGHFKDRHKRANNENYLATACRICPTDLGAGLGMSFLDSQPYSKAALTAFTTSRELNFWPQRRQS